MRATCCIVWALVIWTITVQTSCITQEKCRERYPTKDSSYTREVIISDTDTMWFAEENYYAEDSIPCPPEIKYHKETHTGGHKITVDIDKGKLTVTCHDDSLQRIINKQRHVITSYQSKQGQVVREVVMKTAWYYTFCVWWFVLSIIFILLCILAEILRKKIEI